MLEVHLDLRAETALLDDGSLTPFELPIGTSLTFISGIKFEP